MMESETPIYETSKKLYAMSDACSDQQEREMLRHLAGILETSLAALYEDVYEQLCELIDPHIISDTDGTSACSKNSLCASVVESTQYLLEFWLLNRHIENVKHP